MAPIKEEQKLFCTLVTANKVSALADVTYSEHPLVSDLPIILLNELHHSGMNRPIKKFSKTWSYISSIFFPK